MVLPDDFPPGFFLKHNDEPPPLAALRALVMRDEDSECRYCSKDSWTPNDHAVDCPFRLAYEVLLDTKEIEL